MLLKDGENEIWLCVKHVFSNRKDRRTPCSGGLSMKLGPSGMIFQENERLRSVHDNCVQVQIGA